MIIDTIDLWTKFLNDSTYGIVAELATLPTGSYANVIPPTLIVSQLNNTDVAQDRVPSPFPNLSVYMPIPIREQPNVVTSFREGKVVLDTRYCMSTTDANSSVVQSYYVEHGIKHCLDAFCSNELSAYRTQNSTMIIGTSDPVETYNPYTPIGDGVAMIMVRITFDVRDTQTFE